MTLCFPPQDEIIELREIADDFKTRDKELNYKWLMDLSYRLQEYRRTMLAQAQAIEAMKAQIETERLDGRIFDSAAARIIEEANARMGVTEQRAG